jgi:hypothetical protein
VKLHLEARSRRRAALNAGLSASDLDPPARKIVRSLSELEIDLRFELEGLEPSREIFTEKSREIDQG